MRVFWPISESAQADYEALRAAVLAEQVPASGLAAFQPSRTGRADRRARCRHRSLLSP